MIIFVWNILCRKKFNYLVKIGENTSSFSPIQKSRIYEYANIFHIKKLRLNTRCLYSPEKSILSVCVCVHLTLVWIW